MSNCRLVPGADLWLVKLSIGDNVIEVLTTTPQYDAFDDQLPPVGFIANESDEL